MARLLDAAHAQLGGRIVPVWNNDRRHLSHAMQEAIAAREGPTAFQLPSYAPEPNPAERVWSGLRRGPADLAHGSIDRLAATVKTKLKRM